MTPTTFGAVGGVIFASVDKSRLGAAVSTMDTAMRDWTDKAARGECGWVCSDCCCEFQEGMPDECPHGDKQCTEILLRDKAAATSPGASK